MSEQYDDCETYTVPEFCRVMKIGRNQGYEAVKRGDVPVIRIGKTLRVPKPWVRRILNGEAA
jgi:excisionase family DNA binding protein